MASTERHENVSDRESSLICWFCGIPDRSGLAKRPESQQIVEDFLLSKLGPYELNTIITGDARELAKAIPDDSVDLILCDPVYWEYWQYELLAQVGQRILKPGGSIVAQAGNVHRLQAEINMEGYGLTVAPLINEKMNGGGYQDFNNRAIYFDKPYIWRIKTGKKERGWMHTFVNGLGRDKSNHEWGDTPAVFYMALDRLTNEGDIVLDPFTGGGTVPAACITMNRKYMAFEIDPDTAESARQRVANTQPPLPIVYATQGELL